MFGGARIRQAGSCAQQFTSHVTIKSQGFVCPHYAVGPCCLAGGISSNARSFTSSTGGSKLQAGSTFPQSRLNLGLKGPFLTTNDKYFLEKQKVLVVGLPGAFTPTWTTQQAPAYLAAEQELRAAGINEVLIFTVNDGAVTSFWNDYLRSIPPKIKTAEEIKKNPNYDKSSFVQIAADPQGQLAKLCGMELTADGPQKVLGYHRSKRFAAVVEAETGHGVVKWVDVSEKEDDPAGDDDPSKTMPDAVLRAIKDLSLQS